MQQIIEGKKRVILSNKVGRWKVPAWPELTLTHVHTYVAQIPWVAAFFPDDFDPTHPRADRDFFWGVVGFLCPKFVPAVIEDARTQRQQRLAQRRQVQVDVPRVKVSGAWKALLSTGTFQSRKSGRTHFPSPIRTKRQEQVRASTGAQRCQRGEVGRASGGERGVWEVIVVGGGA